MRSPVFGNEFFDRWLEQKTTEILAKVEKENMSTEDMLVLSLKAQVNHFHHMDIEFRDEFQSIREQFKEVDRKFEQVYKRFEQVDKRFDRIERMMMWGFALFVATQIALYFKL